jgi:hypothetical protein
MTVAACAAVALFAALPAAPVLAAGTSQAVMVIGSSVMVLDSASVDVGASPPSAAVDLTDGTEPLVQQLSQAGETETRLDVQIYVSSSGLGTDSTLSSALVTKVSLSSANSPSPPTASVSFAGETASATK